LPAAERRSCVGSTADVGSWWYLAVGVGKLIVISSIPYLF
jgi:hypothetical protein